VIDGLSEAQAIHRRGPSRPSQAVSLATLEWVGWFYDRRLLPPIGKIPPAEAGAQYSAIMDEGHMAA